MTAFDLLILWAAGLTMGWGGRQLLSGQWRLAGVGGGFLLAVVMLALGALWGQPWKPLAWVIVVVVVLLLPRLQSVPATGFWIGVLSGLAWITAADWLPLPVLMGGGLLMALPFSLIGLMRQFGGSLLDLWLHGLLNFLSLLTGLLLLITGITHLWLIQVLVVCAGLILLRLTSGASVVEAERISQAVRAERERIYQNLHDDIGSRLLTLIYRATTPEEADFARCLLQDLRDAVARTVQLRINLTELLADQKSETEQRLLDVGIKICWPAPENLPDLPLPPLVVSVLRRSLRELVSNVIRHAQASNIVLECEVSDRGLDIRMTDDGVGMQAKANEGRGMVGIRERVQRLGGSVRWTQAAQGGTQVELYIPLSGGVSQ